MSQKKTFMAYGTPLQVSDVRFKCDGKEFHVASCICSECGYVFFFPALPEHEPSLCPNCGIRFAGCHQ